MKNLHLGQTAYTIDRMQTKNAYIYRANLAKGILKILQDSPRIPSFTKEIAALLDDKIVMYDQQALLEKIQESYKTWYFTLESPISKSFLQKFVEDYTNTIAPLSKEMKNKYHIKEAIKKWNLTWFAKRQNSKYDFFFYREDFIFSGNDTEYLKSIQNDPQAPEELKTFLKKCQIIYDASLFAFLSCFLTLNYFGSFNKRKISKQIPLNNIISRLAIRDYTKMFPEWNLNADAHVDSSLINSVLYQSIPWLEVSPYNKNEYKKIIIPSGEMIVFGWREVQKKTDYIFPTPHKVVCDADRRISMWFDINAKSYQKFVQSIADDVYQDF